MNFYIFIKNSTLENLDMITDSLQGKYQLKRAVIFSSGAIKVFFKTKTYWGQPKMDLFLNLLTLQMSVRQKIQDLSMRSKPAICKKR